MIISVLRRLFFSEVSPLIRIGRSRPLEESDFIKLESDLNPEQLPFVESSIKWTNANDFLFGIFPLLKRRLMPAYSWYALGLSASLISPLIMNLFLKQIKVASESTANLNWALLLGVGLGFCGLVTGFSYQQYFRNTLASYQILVNLLNKKIFKHSLQLSLGARQKVQLGDVVNHMSSDSESVADFPLIAADIVWAIISVVAGLGMLFYFLGSSAWVALFLMLLLIPLTRTLASNFFHLDEDMMNWRDKRVSLLGQSLNAIRIVKYFVWEKSVSAEIQNLRNHEIKSRTKLARSEVLATMSFMLVSSLVLFVVLLVHSLRGQELNVPLVFTCFSIFALMEEPFGSLSGLISRWTAARVGAGRIIEYLQTQKVPEYQVIESEVFKSLKIVNQSWGYNSPVLQGVNLDIKAGESIAVIGPVGSGKSTFLLGLLGEIPSFQGETLFNDQSGKLPKISFVPQESYILSGSLLENILFGAKTTNQAVRRALHLSCLDKDVRMFESGLRTEIGEKGVNLSGGQKQRVALARAIINEADLILLDDPLSAVDVETEAMLCERLIFGEWKNRTRIVVTHRLKALQQFDRIIFLNQGRIELVGTYDELQSSVAFRSFVKDHATSLPSDSEKAVAVKESSEPLENPTDVKAAKLVVDEDREVGTVKGSLYWDYIKSLGGSGVLQYWIVLSLFLIAIATTAAPLLQKWWLGYFTSNNDRTFDWSVIAGVGIYGLLGGLVLVLGTLSHLFWLNRGLIAGKRMHDEMLKSVLHAPISFFDSTPVGRILQRFSRDIETVDIHLQRSFESNVHCFFEIVTSLVLILALMPVMLLVIFPIGLIYYRIQKDYRGAAREVKRLDSIARSPRYAHFKETLQGVSVIRAFHRQQWYFEEFYKRLARSQKAFFNHYMLNRWFSARVPIVGGMVAMCSGFFVVFAVKQGRLDQATAGLLMTYSMTFWTFLNWGIRMFSDVESRMTSIERLHFFMNLPQEAPVRLSSPSIQAELDLIDFKGHIKFENVHLRYAPQFPLILKDLSFEVGAGQRVGLIGRTGSGKSTLLQALFRFVELESGWILLDGIDIASIPLERLRRLMAIIPQDPTLFIGSVRSNLDRYNEFSDAEVWQALEHVGLKETVQGLSGQLAYAIAEGGANLSQGQRQLICMARALLMKAKVIIMDEATASVDVVNDELIQKVVRESFRGITMLIVAHRLSTIEDADLVIELKEGRLKQQGPFHSLTFEADLRQEL